MYMCVSGHNVSWSKKKKAWKPLFKREENSHILFNKLDSIFALLMTVSLLLGKVDSYLSMYLSLSHVQAIHVLFQITMYLYRYFNTFYQERDVKNIFKLDKKKM